MKKIVFESSLDELDKTCQKILELVPKSKIILLKGDLAAGKTTFVAKCVALLGLEETVSSPTFSVMNEYANVVKHYDIYQNGAEGFLKSGLLESLEEDGKYYFIEWADEKIENILAQMGFDFLRVNIIKDEDKRKYEVEVNACA